MDKEEKFNSYTMKCVRKMCNPEQKVEADGYCRIKTFDNQELLNNLYNQTVEGRQPC